jgi:hypothetical protein
MGRLTQGDLDRLLDQTIFAWDTSTMLSGVIGFLEFSESNLSWQRRREMKKAEHEADTARFEPGDEHLEGQYRQHLIDNVAYGFDVSLSQRVRYAGLVAFVTSLEWSSKGFAKYFAQKLPKTPRKENRHVHFLAHVNEVSSSSFTARIEELRNLVRIRDCIVHSAGFLEGHNYDRDVREAVKALKGFSIWSDNYLGTSVHIEKGAIEKYAASASDWVPKLVERCVKAGFIRGWP